MKKIFYILAFLLGNLLLTTSCLRSGLEELTNSSKKELTAVNYSYRFLYNDTIKKGTVNEEILKDRVCDVIFTKVSEAIKENGIPGFRTTITHSLNSVQKAGPSGSVTKAMLYNKFKELIAKDGITRLWVYVTISDAATVKPVDNAPKLGTPGDFTTDRFYEVKAADGSTERYILKTVKGF